MLNPVFKKFSKAVKLDEKLLYRVDPEIMPNKTMFADGNVPVESDIVPTLVSENGEAVSRLGTADGMPVTEKALKISDPEGPAPAVNVAFQLLPTGKFAVVMVVAKRIFQRPVHKEKGYRL